MNNKLKVGDVVEGTYGKMQLVKDFLPLPKELVLKKNSAKLKIRRFMKRT